MDIFWNHTLLHSTKSMVLLSGGYSRLSFSPHSQRQARKYKSYAGCSQSTVTQKKNKRYTACSLRGGSQVQILPSKKREDDRFHWLLFDALHPKNNFKT